MRINVYTYPHPDDYDSEGPQLAGWFDWSKADRWSDSDYNGNGSGGPGRGQAVIRTAKGRWVLEQWTAWQNESDTYEYIPDERAQEWLLRHNEDAAVAEHFGAIEEERGPGRPEIGGRITTAIGDDLLVQLDEWAVAHGVSRAETIRHLLSSALKATRQ